MAKFKKGPSYLTKQNVKMAKQGMRNAQISKIVDARLEKFKSRQQTKQLRRSEYYKTKRTNARAAAVASSITASEESRQKTARIEAQERTKLAALSLDQYSKLINGNQGETNPVNPEDSSSNPSGSWKPNDVL